MAGYPPNAAPIGWRATLNLPRSNGMNPGAQGHVAPLAAVIDGANRNDHKLMRQTIAAIPVERPQPTPEQPQNLCLNKGYDYNEPRALAEEFSFTLHLRTRGEEIAAKRHALLG